MKMISTEINVESKGWPEGKRVSFSVNGDEFPHLLKYSSIIILINFLQFQNFDKPINFI